jgi:hypothetical protein
VSTVTGRRAAYLVHLVDAINRLRTPCSGNQNRKESMDSNSSLQRTPLKLDEETHRLWDVLLRARRDDKNIFMASSYVDCLARYFDGSEPDFVLPVSPELKALMQRAKDLADDWVAHEAESDKSLQDVAWKFASHAYGLHRDDYVRYGNRFLFLNHLFVIDETVGNLGLRGRIMTKAGIPGKRELEFSLLHKAWSGIPRGHDE